MTLLVARSRQRRSMFFKLGASKPWDAAKACHWFRETLMKAWAFYSRLNYFYNDIKL